MCKCPKCGSHKVRAENFYPPYVPTKEEAIENDYRGEFGVDLYLEGYAICDDCGHEFSVNTNLNEYRVFVVPTKLSKVTGVTIDLWNDKDVLPEEAKEFIRKAEELGMVYSLKGFQVAFNINQEVDPNTHYIFMTNLW